MRLGIRTIILAGAMHAAAGRRGWWNNPRVPFYDELEKLLQETADKVDAWTSQGAWVIEPGSKASVEVSNAESRLDGSPWGERPVRTAYALAQMATKLTVEMAKCVASLVKSARPAPGIETLTRTSLESGASC